MQYKANNGKVVETDKMDRIIDLDYEGQYGQVTCDLYRTRRSHNWYKISESSWAGDGAISDAVAISLEEAASLIMEDDPDSISDYPELLPYRDQVIDA